MRFGFASRPLDDAARSYFRTDSGMLVTEVAGGTPAARAGWMPGDVITRIDGVPVASGFPQTILDSLAAADSHTVVIRRGGALRSTALSRLAPVPDARANGDLGIALAAPSSTTAVISDVRPGSAAANAGLRSGDRLIRVGSTSVRSLAEAQRLLGQLRSGDSVVFLVFVRDSVARGALVRR
jgi:serine protease Do